MKRLVFLTALFLFCSTSVFFAQESEKDYVDEQNMTVSEVEELIQSQSMINKIDFVFGVEPVISINTHTKSDGKFISAPSPIHFLPVPCRNPQGNNGYPSIPQAYGCPLPDARRPEK